MTDLPTIIDADTGFGEAMNVGRTVQTLENAGVSGLHIEDQVNPKRCGHLDGKSVVDDSTALQRISAAATARRDPNLLIIARTDIRAVSGLKAAIDRAKLLVDAGADMIFPEAMADLAEFAAVKEALGSVPVLANMTEFGKSELFTPRPARLGRCEHRHPPGLAPADGDGRGRARARHAPRRGEPQLGGRRDADPGAALRAPRLRAYTAFDSNIFNFSLDHRLGD